MNKIFFNVGDKVITEIGRGVIEKVDKFDEKQPYQIIYDDGKHFWRLSNTAKLLVDNSVKGFKECFECSQKLGSPTLCYQCLWVRDNFKPEVRKPKFEVGDKATKPKGYKFDSEIVAVFRTTTGEIRIVAENGDGLLHIFNESNLEHEF